jgi:hypothetical protein
VSIDTFSFHHLYYVSENSVDTGGVFEIFDIKDNTAIGRLEHSLANALPFQISAAANAPTGEKAKRSFASFMGVPIYGQTDKQHTSPEVRMERKMERKETRHANKEEKL